MYLSCDRNCFLCRYGNVDVENDWGYYAVGIYAIICNYVIALVFAKVWDVMTSII
jgi:hypothetical protein